MGMSTHDEDQDATSQSRQDNTGTTLQEPTWEQLSDRIAKRLHHIRIELKRGAKKAKTFETRKLVKKLRFFRKQYDQAKNDESTPDEIKLQRQKMVEKFEADVESIKHINMDKIVHNAFAACLSKSSLPHLPNLLSTWDSAKDWTQTDQNTPSVTRVEQRLSSSEPIRDAAEGAIEDLHCLLTGVRSKTRKRKKNPPTQKLSTVSKVSVQTDDDDDEADSDEMSRPVTSAFIASLGDSDSELDLSVSEVEESDYDQPASKKVKKNRQGQRARRAQAEKLYGQRAKHLQNASHPPPNSKRAPSSTTTQPVKEVPKETLHPSWEAKRKAKEAQSMILQAGKPKKIVFGSESDED
ncbi:hypothetical protein, variant [Spizellomyces punctatus DAOM BR117]|uniref:Bud22 domain-containing protein n=1 Tax=Spizellomyces punctatus (strain DAOM BR117) TaxID=645134 RepID=A0A0L0HKE7_SPIPD|nr:hypothetical protein, variant [Spizellomyces punctatus DAOM BR117]KND01941.1 hypothetical protein, variant [Spizellomyces punctatus DAOM BR117]|eukprot:XP_016609980.1 hypothetical protein, variant [Spizellomyces punctatus DAOM BR117]